MGHFGGNFGDQNAVDNEDLDHEVSDGCKGIGLESIHATSWLKKNMAAFFSHVLKT